MHAYECVCQAVTKVRVWHDHEQLWVYAADRRAMSEVQGVGSDRVEFLH